MSKPIKLYLTPLILIGVLLAMGSCWTEQQAGAEETTAPHKMPSDVTAYADHWKLILGDGSNAGHPNDFMNSDYFYVAEEDGADWVVYKSPNAGDTHGTSNNTRTELAQTKKWFARDSARLSATVKVMHVSATGDPRVAASHSVVIGQIHSADGHENEPLKIFYKKFPRHAKGSVFWHYEINTEGDDNAGRWDFSTPVWGHDFSVVADADGNIPAEPADGIALGETLNYVIEVADGTMRLTFSSPGHETKTFTKSLVESAYTRSADIPAQTQALFVPIGQDGVERPEAYAAEGLFFKLGCYNQTNGKSPSVNPNWCSGAETHGGNLEKQYETGDYAEVWFQGVSLFVSDEAISNEGYFLKND